MRCRPQAVLTARAFIARTVLAVLLPLVVTANALPPGALAAALSCPMPCCRGGGAMADGPGGSCDAHLAKQAAKPVESDPVCGAIGGVSVTHDGATHAQHAAPKGARAHVHIAHRIEHNSAQPVSEQNTTAQGAVGVGPSMSRPCSPDCCGATLGSGAQLRRTRDGAALARGFSLRTPTLLVTRRVTMRHVIASSDLRRHSSPRAPPIILIA